VRGADDESLEVTRADQLAGETTYDAEFVALTQLQATSSSRPTAIWRGRSSGLVESVTIDALRTA
jgi:hypothetical protein